MLIRAARFELIAEASLASAACALLLVKPRGGASLACNARVLDLVR